MKLILAYILYHTGDYMSYLLRYDRMSWLYPVYSKIMRLSCDLDVENKLWKLPK